MGRIVRDIELRRTNSGTAVASFCVAVDRDFSGKDGGEKETDFIDCVAFRQTGEFVSKYFSKGRMIVVSGRLQIRNWTDNEGKKRRSAEVIAENCYFGDSKPAQESGGQPQNGFQTPQGYQNPQSFQQPQSYQQPQNFGYQQPQFNQQGFGGYQQPSYPQQSYQAPPPAMGSYAQITDDDAQLPF
jgi:single-strand DNA-binding protein